MCARRSHVKLNTFQTMDVVQVHLVIVGISRIIQNSISGSARVHLNKLRKNQRRSPLDLGQRVLQIDPNSQHTQKTGLGFELTGPMTVQGMKVELYVCPKALPALMTTRKVVTTNTCISVIDELILSVQYLLLLRMPCGLHRGLSRV